MGEQKILVLEIASGPCKQTQYSASPGEELVVGRDPASSCYLVDPRLSREHFLISFCGQNWKIRDLKSANGTFVNSERISDRELADGDHIRAGDTMFIATTKNDTCLNNRPKKLPAESDFDG